MNKKILLPVLILFVAAFLRFYQLGQNPPSLTWDEAAWGYNAYSLGIDGKDEFGRLLPHDYLESFGDFKPPVYAYLDIVPVKIFGLNEFAVRFPSAFFGVLTVLVTYFLVKRLFLINPKSEIRNPKQIQNLNDQNTKHWKLEIPVIATAILAISPWHINLSRAAFEANIATFFIVLGVWLFLKWVQTPLANIKRGGQLYLIFSVTSFVLSINTFNSARVFVPIIFLGLAFGFRKQLLERKKQAAIAFIIGFLLMLPTLKFLLSPQAGLRFKEVNIFSDLGVIERTNREIANDNNSPVSKFLHNRRFAYGVEFLRHYFDNFNPDFLFIKGDGNPKFSTRDVGQLYIWELPFLIIGILFLFRYREGNWWIIPFWLIMAIVPAATARETPHALRAETALPTFQILIAYGIVNIFKKISNLKVKNVIIIVLALSIFFNFLYYFHGYYAHYPKEFSGEWQYGYKESISYIKSVQDQYDGIYFTESLGRPYIYFLFYTQYNPSEFRKTALVEREAFGFVHVRSFDKYKFIDKEKNKIDLKAKILYVDTPFQVPGYANVKEVFYLLNKDSTLVAYTL